MTGGWAGLACGAALLFLWLTLATMGGSAAALDEAARAAVHGLAGPTLTTLAATVTWLGTLGVLALFGAAVLAWLWRRGRRAAARLLVVTMAGALVLENGLKFTIRRPRPAAFFGTDPTTYSFPSGHALFSLCFYGMLAIVLARELRRSGAAAALGGAALLLVGAIGLSRIYLGVHYPSDVLAGYLVAAGWIGTVLAGERRWTARRGIPPRT